MSARPRTTARRIPQGSSHDAANPGAHGRFRFFPVVNTGGQEDARTLALQLQPGLYRPIAPRPRPLSIGQISGPHDLQRIQNRPRQDITQAPAEANAAAALVDLETGPPVLPYGLNPAPSRPVTAPPRGYAFPPAFPSHDVYAPPPLFEPPVPLTVPSPLSIGGRSPTPQGQSSSSPPDDEEEALLQRPPFSRSGAPSPTLRPRPAGTTGPTGPPSPVILPWRMTGPTAHIQSVRDLIALLTSDINQLQSMHGRSQISRIGPYAQRLRILQQNINGEKLQMYLHTEYRLEASTLSKDLKRVLIMNNLRNCMAEGDWRTSVV